MHKALLLVPMAALFALQACGEAPVDTTLPNESVSAHDNMARATEAGAGATGSSAAGGEWVLGQWGPISSPPCSSWIRLSPDHTIGDNAGSTGTWSLSPGYGGADTLVMTVTGQAPRSGPVAHGAGNTMVMGSGPGSVTWQREQC